MSCNYDDEPLLNHYILCVCQDSRRTVFGVFLSSPAPGLGVGQGCYSGTADSFLFTFRSGYTTYTSSGQYSTYSTVQYIQYSTVATPSYISSGQR